MIPKTSDVVARLRAGEKPPREAMHLRFAAVKSSGENKSRDSKSIKVHIKARSRGPIEHYFWGTMWHDLNSYRTAGSEVALDDSHGTEIGRGRPRLTGYGLEIDGIVITNPECPGHESNRVAYNLRNGIPQEASIDFSGDYDVVEVPEGMRYPVNGLQAAGPCLVVTNWPLRAVAICKSGADASTEATAFARDKFGKLPRTISTLGTVAASRTNPSGTVGSGTMKWADAVEQTRQSMPQNATGPEVIAEAIQRHPDIVARLNGKSISLEKRKP